MGLAEITVFKSAYAIQPPGLQQLRLKIEAAAVKSQKVMSYEL